MTFLAGLNLLMRGKGGKGAILRFLASYGLVSTKNYFWACLMVALILSSVIFLIQGITHWRIIKFVAAGFLVPLIAFTSTTSAYALNFIFRGSISETRARSRDSISQVYVD